MPGGDRTGPLGFGPMTGRAVGYCAGFANFAGGRMGMGFRRGGFSRGNGRGFRRGFLPGYPAYPPVQPVYPEYGANYPYQGNLDPKQEMDILQTEAENIKIELEAVHKRIAELKKEQEVQT